MRPDRAVRALRATVFALALLAGAAGLASPPMVARPAKEPKALLIVAPSKFHPALRAFVRHKRAQLPTRLVALEKALAAGQGQDDPERLKHYLYAAWKKNRIGYVLLVGDADVLPVRFMVLDRVTPAAFDYAFYPSDLYYGDLARADGSFDDWNARKEAFHAGYYGEVRGEKNKGDPINYDEISYRPEIGVGRWPVSSEAEVEIIAAKTIAYERQVCSGNRPGLRRAALFNVGGWVDSRAAMDRWAGTLASRWQVEKRYYADAARNDHTPPPTGAELVRLLNEEPGLGLAIHSGHGEANAWNECLTLERLGLLRNSHQLPVMVSAGCSTAYFATLPPYQAYVDVAGVEHKGTDAGEVFHAPPPPPAPYQRGQHNAPGLGEQLLRGGPNGAVAYFGCNTGSQPCGLTLVEGFVNALAGARETRLGDCWMAAVSYYFEEEHLARLKPDADWYPPSIFFQGMKFMLFGDPSLRLP